MCQTGLKHRPNWIFIKCKTQIPLDGRICTGAVCVAAVSTYILQHKPEIAMVLGCSQWPGITATALLCWTLGRTSSEFRRELCSNLDAWKCSSGQQKKLEYPVTQHHVMLKWWPRQKVSEGVKTATVHSGWGIKKEILEKTKIQQEQLPTDTGLNP